MASYDKLSYCSVCGDQYATKNPPRIKCPECGGKMINTQLTFEEVGIIEHISKETNFLLAMIELKEKDVIEYQTKLAQFRSQAKEDGYYSKPKHRDILKCPKCGSTAITTGARGANHFWGLIGASKTVNRCGNCGHTWTPRG